MYIAVATIEADKAIASSDFLKIMGISPQKGANRRFWSVLIISPCPSDIPFNVWPDVRSGDLQA